MTTQKTWNDMTDAEREAFRQTPAYLDPTNPARVPWEEWSDEAKGAVALAFVDDADVQHFDVYAGVWHFVTPRFNPLGAYRIPPEPKRETVQLEVEMCGGTLYFLSQTPTHALTIPTIDGAPDLTKCPHCGTAPIDMEKLK